MNVKTLVYPHFLSRDTVELSLLLLFEMVADVMILPVLGSKAICKGMFAHSPRRLGSKSLPSRPHTDLSKGALGNHEMNLDINY